MDGATDFLANGGEMGERIRAFDWARHPLGAPAEWPQALRIVTQLVLSSQHPAMLLWGDGLFCIYNDALAQSWGPARHSEALGAPGREFWAEVWPTVGGDIEAVLAGRGATYREDQLVPLRRGSAVQDLYWTYSYSPVAHDGGVGGVLVLCSETTARVLEARRRAEDRERQQRLFEQAPGFILIMRGPDHLVEFVNDAHRRVFGSEEWVGKTLRRAFPSLEGQGFFEKLDHVYATGETFEANGIPMRYRRSADAAEEVRNFTFMYAPLHGDDGDVVGIFCEGFDVTEGKQAELRHAVLAELADRLRDEEDPDAAAAAAAETLGRALGVSRAGYGTIDTAAETIVIERDWNAPGVQSIAGTLHFRDYGSYIDDLKAGRTAVVEDADLDPRTAATAASLKAISAHAFVNMPVTEQGGLVALLFLNHAEPRPWSAEELALIREVAERTRAVVERRRAEHALKRNEARLRFLDELASATARVHDADAVMAITTRMLGHAMAASDCDFADVEADGDSFNIRGHWHASRARSTVGTYSLAAFGALTREQLGAGKPLIINDNAEDLDAEGTAAFQAMGVRATLCIPFIKEGRLTAMMAVHHDRPHRWREDELNLLREVTERSWAHIERVRAEAALHEREGQLRLALDAARIGTWSWNLAEGEGSWSARTAEIMGLDGTTRLTRELRDRLTHSDDHERVHAAMRDAVVRNEQFSAEYRIIRPDGAVRWVSSRGVVQRDEAGAPHHITGTVRDVTERREAQDALTALNATLEEQVAQRTAERDRMWRLSGDLFLVLGSRGEIRAVNPAASSLLGYTPEAVLGQRLNRYIHPNDLSAVAAATRATARGPIRDFIARLRTVDGRWRRFEWSAAPGDAEAYVIGRDVTDELERREALEQTRDALRQAQKMESLGQLTGGVAHDFNNLLTPILGSLDLLKRSRTTTEREQRQIASALEAAERARTLVQRLLAFSRRQPLQAGPVDMAELINGMDALIASTSGPQIDVRIDVPADLPPAHADANQLELAILNLSVNARDAMPEGGRLTLAAASEDLVAGNPARLEPGRYVRLSVSDTGLGMDAETMARAVEPFFSTKGVGKGTGLGLSMVHGLTSQLGGAMLLSSRPGLGTTVDLLLPIARSQPAPRVEDRAPPATAAGAGLVLLVDDEAAVRATTRALLRDLGYQVVDVQSASEALTYLEGNGADYLVTDHLMPGVTGTDLAHMVRERHPDMGVLIVSGYADLDAVSPDLPRLAKPFRRDELARVMTRLR